MPREISLKELYSELAHDPDLRRLGPYRVVATKGQTILPIEVNLEGQDVYLGEGDFRDGFVAFADSRVRCLDLGSSRFTDLYLDNLQAESLLCGEAKASRLYFDYAQIAECRFNDFVTPEVYFDEGSIGEIVGERLRAGIIYPERLNCPDFKSSDVSSNGYRIMPLAESADIKQVSNTDTTNDSHLEVREISVTEFERMIGQNPDLRRLGPYKVVPDSGSEEGGILHINLELRDHVINFGKGDFTGLKVELGETKSRVVDLADSKFDVIDFAAAEVGDCFLAGSEMGELGFGKAKIVNIFGEQAKASVIRFDTLECEQFNANEVRAKLFQLKEAHVRELYLSRGDGIEGMYFDSAVLELLNLHEGKVGELHFGQSTVRMALINKASVRELNIEGLRSDRLYIDSYKNEIDMLRFEQTADIGEINIERALRDAARRVIGNIEGYPHEVKDSEADQQTDIKGAEARDVWREGSQGDIKNS